MPAPYSIDIRERVVTLYNTETYTLQGIADSLLISISTVKRYISQHRDNESLEPKFSTGRTPILSDEELIILSNMVDANPAGTLKWYRNKLKKQLSKVISISSMGRILTNLGFTRKKKVYMHKSKINQKCR